MSDQPDLTELNKIKEDIGKALAELGEKMETIRDELLESMEDNTKELGALIAQVLAHQKNVIEANQKKIWNEGIGAIMTKLEEFENAESTEEKPT